MKRKKVKGIMLTWLLAATLGLAFFSTETPSVSASFNTLFVEALGTNDWDFTHSVVDVDTINFSGCVVVGDTYRWGINGWNHDALIAVIDGDGNFVSGLTHVDLGLEVCYDVIKVSGSDDVVVVGTSSSLNPAGDLFIARFHLLPSSILMPVWMTICRDGNGSIGLAVNEDPNPPGPSGGFVVTGVIWGAPGSFGGMDVIIAKFDYSDGSFLWGTVLSGPGDDCASSIHTMPTHRFIAGWTTSFGSMDILVAKFDGSGVLDCAYAYGLPGPTDEVATSIGGIIGGNLEVTGWTTFAPFGGKDFFIARFNPSTLTLLPPLWIYGGTGDDEAASLTYSPTVSMDFIITGTSTSPPSAGGKDLMIVKVDRTTNAPIWGWLTGGTGDDGGFKIIGSEVAEDPGGLGFAVAGFTYSWGHGPEDILLATFNQQGITATYPYCQRNFTFNYTEYHEIQQETLDHTELVTHFPPVEPHWLPIPLSVWRRCYRPPLQPIDLMVGCVQYDGNYTVLGYRGTGTSAAPTWERMEEWDIHNVPGDRPRASPCFADLDDDGDYDLLISNARYNYAPMGYKNIGNATHPVWQRCPEWDVPSLGGYEQNPDLADLDNDGDYDLVVGNEADHSVRFFENTGNKTRPVWTRKPEWDIPSPGVNWPSPAFADLDFDEDYDLTFVGYTQGYAVAWENNGTAQSLSWNRKPEWDITGLPPNVNKHLDFADLDEDGDYDLFFGVSIPYLNITAYENTGKPTSPVWTRKPEWDIKTPKMASMTWIRPAFANLDEGIHNIAITSLTTSKTVVGQGYTMHINITLTNEGNYPETVDPNIHLWIPPEEDIDLPDPWENVTLTPGQTKTLTFTWNTTGFAKGSYTLWAYAWQVLGETDIADNTYTDGWILVTRAGDFGTISGGYYDFDDKCDYQDLFLFRKAYVEAYHPHCDFDNDLDVDYLDLFQFRQCYIKP